MRWNFSHVSQNSLILFKRSGPKAIKFDLSLTFPLNAPFVKVRHIKRELV